MTIVVNNSTLVEDLIIEVVLGVVGFFLSERYKRTRGVPPWRCPSAVWALVWFLFPLLGAIVYAIACFTTRPPANPSQLAGCRPELETRPRAHRARPPRVDGARHPRPAGAHSSPRAGERPRRGAGRLRRATRAPRLPGGWEAPPAAGTAYPGFHGSGPRGHATCLAGGAEAPPARQVPRSWLADPAGRHELRYWDGTKFTEHVADAGQDHASTRSERRVSLAPRGRMRPHSVYSLPTCWAKGVPAISPRRKAERAEPVVDPDRGQWRSPVACEPRGRR